jgi:hypothetical protein
MQYIKALLTKFQALLTCDNMLRRVGENAVGRSYDSQGYGGGIRPKSKSHCD